MSCQSCKGMHVDAITCEQYQRRGGDQVMHFLIGLMIVLVILIIVGTFGA